MAELSFRNAIRYLFAGVIAWGYLAILDLELVVSQITLLFLHTGDIGGTAILTVTTTVGGTLIYFLYRTLIYELIIYSMQDNIRRCFGDDNYRTDLMERYGISTREANTLASLFEQELLKERSEGRGLSYSGTHLLYITAALGWFVILLTTEQAGIAYLLRSISIDLIVFPLSKWALSKFTLILIATILFSFVGFLKDWNDESYERLLFLSIPQIKRDILANDVGFVRRKISESSPANPQKHSPT